MPSKYVAKRVYVIEVAPETVADLEARDAKEGTTYAVDLMEACTRAADSGGYQGTMYLVRDGHDWYWSNVEETKNTAMMVPYEAEDYDFDYELAQD